ncbi:hypothetical protein CC79DRAFT_198480 [Sarocladium strictum]
MTPPPSHGSSTSGGEHSALGHSPADKAHRVVALQACAECRKKRAKCDGQRPCRRCQTQNSECFYDTSTRRTREDLHAELQSLQDQQTAFDQLIAAVAEPGISAQVLGYLHTGHSPQTVLSWVKAARLSTTSSSFSPQFSVSDVTSRSSGHQRASGWGGSSAANRSNLPQAPGKAGNGSVLLKARYVPEDTAISTGLEETLWPLGPPTTAAAPEAWTSLTSDPFLIRHLLALYFCWEYPLFTPLSREHFMKDFHDGRHRFCSPLLVNAMLALGSTWDAQHTPGTQALGINPHSDRFYEESMRLLKQKSDRRSLATIQALGIISMWEISRGRDLESRYHSVQSVRLAIDMGLHRKTDDGDGDLHYVQSLTFWGAFSLDCLLSVGVGSLPQYPLGSPCPPTPAVPLDIEQSPWLPYTGEILPRPPPSEQPSNIRSTYHWLCELAKRIYETLHILYSPDSQVNAAAVLNAYTGYLSWYDQMPEALRLGLNSTPSVLVSHMCFHFAIIHLFHPFLDLDLVGAKLSPARICHQAADAIQWLLKSYSEIHTLKRAPVFVPFLALASAISHLEKRIIDDRAYGSDTDDGMDVVKVSGVGSHTLDALDQDINGLRIMSGWHYSASQAISFLKNLAEERKFDINIQEGVIPAKDFDRLAKPYMHRISLAGVGANTHKVVVGEEEDVE